MDIYSEAKKLSNEIKQARNSFFNETNLNPDPVNGLEYIFRKGINESNATSEMLSDLINTKETLILDIHSIICKKANDRCYYCNLPYLDGDVPIAKLNGARPDSKLISNWLIKELNMWLTQYPRLRKIPCEAVYFGGNWSRVHIDVLKGIIEFLKDNIIFSPAIQFTFELFPVVSPEVLLYLRSFPFDYRVSFGLQDTHDCVLEQINRRHNRRQAIETIKKYVDAGCRVNVDLLVGLPGQTEEAILENYIILEKMGVQSISLYPMSLKGISEPKKKKLGLCDYKDGIFTFKDSTLDSDYARALVHMYATKFSNHRRDFYPIGWYCIDRQKDIPKMIKYQWDSQLLSKTFDLSIGMGPTFTSECTVIPIDENGHKEEILERLFKSEKGVLPIKRIDQVNESSRILSEFSNDLRLRKKIDIVKVSRWIKVLKKMEKAGLIKSTNDIINLTEQGLFLINEIDEYLMSNN